MPVHNVLEAAGAKKAPYHEKKHRDDADDDAGYDSSFDDDYKTKLNKWGFGKYADKFNKKGLNEPNSWGKITTEELKVTIGMKPAHSRKWKTKMRAWQKKLDLKAEREGVR